MGIKIPPKRIKLKAKGKLFLRFMQQQNDRFSRLGDAYSDGNFRLQEI